MNYPLTAWLGVWAREFHAHCPLVHEIIVWDAKERRKGAIRQPAGHLDLQIVVTNYETFGTHVAGETWRADGEAETTGRFKNRELPHPSGSAMTMQLSS